MNSQDNSNLHRMWTSSSRNELPKNVPPDHCQSSVYNSKWEQDHSVQYNLKQIESQLIQQDGDESDWDPKAMISNLSFLQQKVYQLQDMVHMIVARKSQSTFDQSQDLVTQQQQLITADITSVIVQLISLAGSLLPTVKQQQTLGDFIVASQTEQQQMLNVEDQEVKDEEEEEEEGENLVPGSFEILQLEKEEILAPHTHFCGICGKGFKRDANLRMHMRGHGDEYKTAAALAKPPPNKEKMGNAVLIKRYSCPYSGCKRNKEHKKFQSLKTILCVKNHYKRTHCEKRFMCSRCNTKKFSVIADLKTHEKHCGRDKWLCSCGTTFSRKDKLFGHITLFQGHTPAIPVDENCKASSAAVATAAGASSSAVVAIAAGAGASSSAAVATTVGAGASSSSLAVDPTTSGFFSPMETLDDCSEFNEFSQPVFDDDSENTFSFLLSGSCSNNSSYPPQNNGVHGQYHSNDL